MLARNNSRRSFHQMRCTFAISTYRKSQCKRRDAAMVASLASVTPYTLVRHQVLRHYQPTTPKLSCNFSRLVSPSGLPTCVIPGNTFIISVTASITCSTGINRKQ
jgi:hypothetical protein